MSAPVDVLAVMDDLRGVMYGPLIDGKPGTDSPLDAQAVEARASVAELIDAVKSEREIWRNEGKRPGWIGRVEAAKARTDAAIERVGGA